MTAVAANVVVDVPMAADNEVFSVLVAFFSYCALEGSQFGQIVSSALNGPSSS
jgi:hypothetical protein